MGRGRRLGIGQVQQLLIASALSLLASACSLPADRETRAYNVCLARHAQETAICEDCDRLTRLRPLIFRRRL
jgi:hypothetical protein